MELGKVYKIQYRGSTFIGIVAEHKDSPERSLVYTTTGGLIQVFKEFPVTLATPRLKAEVRQSLHILYKLHCEKLKIEEIRDQNQRDMWENQRKFADEKINIKTYSNDFNMDDLAAEFREISSYSSPDPSNAVFSFHIDKMVGKYMSPDNYSFLDREYDGTVFVWDYEECAKQFGIQVSVDEIEKLKKQLSHTSLVEVSDEADIGDKSSLYVSKIFTFRIKKGVSYSEIKEECTLIQNWISQFAN